MNQLIVQSPAPGARIYKYQLIDKVGQGHYGQVWLATDRALNREFAIKILNPGISVDDRLREAQIGNALEHNNLVHVHQADVVPLGQDHVVILAMDYFPNGSVERMANPAKFLTLPDVMKIAKDILQGLDYLHANNFFHNDIKPGNVLVGAQAQAMLSDYGITGVSTSSNPVVAPDVYNPHSAPEVRATGNINAQTDIFQVGLTIYRLLVGILELDSRMSSLGMADYFDAIDAGTLITKKDFPAFVPAPLRRIVLQSIDSDPANRFRNSLEMRRKIERLSFPGFWTVDASGQLVGEDDTSEYRIDWVTSGSNTIDLTCTKETKTTGTVRRVVQYCGTGLTQKQAEKKETSFINFVVTGK